MSIRKGRETTHEVLVRCQNIILNWVREEGDNLKEVPGDCTLRWYRAVEYWLCPNTGSRHHSRNR